MITPDKMRAIVARHVKNGELGAPSRVPDVVGLIERMWADQEGLLGLLRAVAERVQPRRGLLANECPLCGGAGPLRGIPLLRMLMGSDAHQRHLIDCPALVLEVLRGG